MLKKTVIFLICCIWTIQLFSQNDWKIGYEDAEVKVSFYKAECERADRGTHIEYFYLKLENLSDHKVLVHLKKELWYNNECLTCNASDDEYYVDYTLEKSEVLEGSCFENTDRNLRVFSKMLNVDAKSVLTKFEIIDVTVKTVE